MDKIDVINEVLFRFGGIQERFKTCLKWSTTSNRENSSALTSASLHHYFMHGFSITKIKLLPTSLELAKCLFIFIKLPLSKPNSTNA